MPFFKKQKVTAEPLETAAKVKAEPLETPPTKKVDASRGMKAVKEEPAGSIHARYPKRHRRSPGSSSISSSSSSSRNSISPSGPSSSTRRGKRPTGRVLVVHANTKEYGLGAKGPKESNRHFAFLASDYVAMRDSGAPYCAYKNPLLPLPRPTYTEFMNRAKKAGILQKVIPYIGIIEEF